MTEVDPGVMPTTRQGRTLAELAAAAAPLTAADLRIQLGMLRRMRAAGWITPAARGWSILPAGLEILARWQAAICRNPPDFTLATLRMTFPPLANGSVVTFDGSTDNASVGACAAVAGSGHALVGWWQFPPINAIPLSTHAELQGLRLALRLTAALGVTEIRTDSQEMAREVQAAKDGGTIPARITGGDQAAETEVAAQLLSQPVTVLWEGMSRGGNPHIAAATPAGLLAHKLAITACRMVRDGFDPAAERGFLRSAALKDPSSRKYDIALGYRQWKAKKQRNAETNGCASAARASEESAGTPEG